MLISRANPIPIRDLDTPYIGKLVRLSGIIISTNSITSKATSIHISCRSCRHVKLIDVGNGISGITFPRTCDRYNSFYFSEPDATGDKAKCPIDPYIVLHDKSTFIDQQMLKVQEPHGLVPVGELPRHLLLCVDRYIFSHNSYLTGKVTPGMRVTITGIFDIFNHAQQKQKSAGNAIALRSPYIQVCGLQLDPDANGSQIRSFTAQEEEEFLQMSRRPKIYSEFTSSIAPQIFGADGTLNYNKISKWQSRVFFSAAQRNSYQTGFDFEEM